MPKGEAISLIHTIFFLSHVYLPDLLLLNQESKLRNKIDIFRYITTLSHTAGSVSSSEGDNSTPTASDVHRLVCQNAQGRTLHCIG